MQDKPVVLVNPPLSAREQAGSFADVANVMQSLGIGYIASVLEREGFGVRIIDCRPLGMTLSQVVEEIKAMKPSIIGVTATVLEIERCNTLSRELKRSLPDSLLVIGGPHVSTLPEETLENSSFDIGVIGEGEMTMLEIARHVACGNFDFGDVEGIIYRTGEGLERTRPRAYIQDLDSLPFPARHLFPPLSSYRPVPASYIRLPLGHIMTSRGCPFQCIFCDRKVFGNEVRMRSPENVVDEMEHLVGVHGAREIKFFDDTFTVDQGRAFKIFDEMESRGIKVPWSCLTRVNLVTRELLFRMREVGCWQVAFGLESGDQDMLDRMKKGITVEQSINAVRWAKEAGLNVRAYFVLGMPGETIDTIRKTTEFARSLPLDVATFYALTLYPGNELYDIARQEGKIVHQDYSLYNPIVDLEKGRLAYVPEGMTEKELRAAILEAHRSFYLRPRYILRQLLSVRAFSDLARYYKGFKTIARI